MKQEAQIQFLGAAGTVTGSKFLLRYKTKAILIDAGLFQGLKELRLLNWTPLPTSVEDIDMVLLTHGHLDHTGYLPRLVKQGFKGPIYGTGPTLSIAKIILEDSGKIQEEEAKKANKEGYSKHQPAEPFYTLKEAQNTVKLFQEINADQWIPLSEDIMCRFVYNGHIIGSTFIEIKINEKIIVFSGDIGRANDPLLFDTKKPERADYLIMESTYGDQIHPADQFEVVLKGLISETIQNNGALIVPSFAVERLQLIMFLVWKATQSGHIENIPIYIDSPMGNRVLAVFDKFDQWHKLDQTQFQQMINHSRIVSSYRETWEVINKKGPKIIVAGSGMVTGGRVLTYLQQLIDQSTTQILLVGYQAEGTRGRKLKDGIREIKIYGKYYPVNAKIHSIESLSAHGDQRDLISWIRDLKVAPKHTYLIHGEPQAQEILAEKIFNEMGWLVSIPKLNDIVTLSL
jgi:metallo-beta-lactamase family protein